jgi:resuscitation-promoting factor RpfB
MQRPNRWIALLVALLALTGLAAGYRATLTPITLVVDDETRVVRTHQPTVELLLADLGLALRPEDRLSPDLETALEPEMMVNIQHAHPVVFVVDGRERIAYVHEESPPDLLAQMDVELGAHDTFNVHPPLATDPLDTRFRLVVKRGIPVVLEEGAIQTSLYTNAQTVGEVLLENDIQLYRADRVYPDPATPVQSGLHIRLQRSIPVSVQVDRHTLRTRTHRDHAGEVLADLGIILSGQDYTIPALDTSLGEGAEIRVVRVTESVMVEQSPIPFDTVWQPDPNMEIDHQGLTQEGKPGVLERRIRLRYEDGQIVDRQVEGESVVLAPTNRVMGYGTKVVVRQLQTSSGVVEYWRSFKMLATSYSASTAGVSRDNPHYGYTATGIKMRDGIVAVDPSYINLGSEVYVPGYGVGLAADTGGAIKGKRIDLGYSDANLQLWYSWVEVYLLTPVPDRINYLGP